MARFENLHARANTVLYHLKRLSKLTGGVYWVEPYKNGRERGWAVESEARHGRKVAFAENRNSDDLVVYRGTGRNFDAAGNVPDDETYAQRASYHGTPKAAALAAFAWLSSAEDPAVYMRED